MTKEEKIHEEYLAELSKNKVDKKDGLKFFKNLQPFIKENGWININESEGYTGYLMGSDLEVNFPFLRLKSLQGIEDNNGWIKIESEEDLPTETNTYHFTSRHTGKMMKDYFTADSKVSGFRNCFFKLYSHYQPIKDPEPAIY